MKTTGIIAMVFIMTCLAGCATADTKQNAEPANGSMPIESPVESGSVENSPPQNEEVSPSNDFALHVNGTPISLMDRDYEVDWEGVLGEPVSQQVEELKNADTQTGSYIKRLEYDGLRVTLSSPRSYGDFWRNW